MLKDKIVSLIENGYNVFYDGSKGYFDKICIGTVIELKRQYRHIKIYKILTSYHQDKAKWDLPPWYDGSIMPEIEHYHPKARITKRNEWMVENCDILVCHIVNTYRSGAYRTVKYALKKNKEIIYI